MRYLEPSVIRDLRRKMVLVGGPRQCGKTTMAKAIAGRFRESVYLNWDFDADRRRFQKLAWSETAECLVFDELHKFHRWKNWLKGVYDIQHEAHRILVTGSARLDLYRRGGDSLLGRYHYWRLHPFSLGELPKQMSPREALGRLLNVGGFPEPFLDGDELEAKRWRRERNERIIRDDIRDLEPIQQLQSLQLFLEALKERVGGQIVLSNIADDLQVSPKTLKRWLDVLENMYLVFKIMPYTTHLPRAIQKPPKVYFFDTGDVVGDEGARFENLVATHLLKQLHFEEDRSGDRYGLHYVRDKEAHEVDFVITKNKVVQELIEVKVADAQVSKSLLYFANKLRPRLGCRQILRDVRTAQTGTFQGVRVQSVLDAFRPWPT